MTNHATSLTRALRSLDGLSVGDAFGVPAGVTRDTLCAIAGSIVVMAPGGAGVPPEWLARREPLSAFTHLAGPPAPR